MFKKSLLALGLLAFSALSRAQTPTPIYYGLSGVIQGADGKLFNGRLSIQLAKPSAANLCTSPVSVVSQLPAVFQIVNGAIVNGATGHFLSNSCLSPSIPYFAEIFNDKNAIVYADNWFFPPVVGANIDVGTMSDVGIQTASTTGTGSTATPIVVAIPSAIISNQAVNQSISGTLGTTFTFNVPVVFTKGTTGASGGGGGAAGNTGEVQINAGGGALGAIPGFTYTTGFLDGRSNNLAIAANTFFGAASMAVGSNGGYIQSLPYNTSTGGLAAAHLMACIFNDGTAHACTTSSAYWTGLNNGTGGAPPVAALWIAGTGSCLFDNTATLGDFVTLSTTTAGRCHDAGASYPATGTLAGIVSGSGVSGEALVSLIHGSGSGGAGGNVFPWTLVSGTGGLSYVGQGAYINWNQQGTGGTGETDFINNHGSGPGGFTWYNGNGSIGSIIMSLDYVGNLTTTSNVVANVDVYAGTNAGTGTVHGATFTGNAVSADRASTTFTRNGTNVTICTVGNSTDAMCSGSLSFAAFANNNYLVTIQPMAASGANIGISITSKSAGSFNYVAFCTFNCAAVGTITADYVIVHN